MKARLSQKFVCLSVMLMFVMSCASRPYPYFDSAVNDHNNAPNSLGIPKEFTHQKEQKNKDNNSDFQIFNDKKEETEISIERQSYVDYLFLKAELESADNGGVSSIEILKSALQIDMNSTTLMQKLSIEYYRKGQFVDAVYWVDKALQKEPFRKDLLLLYGSLEMARKDYVKAETAYLKLIKMYPDEPDAYLYLGAVASEKTDFVKARKYFTKVIDLGTYDLKHLPYYYRARTAFDSGDKKLIRSAKKDLENCFELKPDFLEAIQLYATFVEKSHGKQAVIDFFIQYQKQHGPVAKLAEILSQYYIEKDQYDKAYDQLEFLEANTDDVVQVKLKMSLILIDKKSYLKAADKLEELNKLVPESDKVKFYLSAVYEELKQFDKATQFYLQIQPASNHYEDARIRAAFLQKLSAHVDQAIETMSVAIKNKKSSVQVYLMLGQLYEDSEKYVMALDTLKKADFQFPKNSQVNYVLGTLYDKQNDKKSMLKHMKLAVDYDGKNHQAMNYMAYSLSEMGASLDDAESWALKAHDLQKDDPFIIDTVGWVYFKKGQYEKAAEYLEKAHEISPEVGIISEHLGDVYLKLKKDDKARSAYLRAKKEEKDTSRLKMLDSKITSIVNSDQLRSPAAVSGPASYP